MARSQAQWLARLQGIVTPAFAADPHLAGAAAMLALSEANVEGLAAATVPSTSEGVWLRLIARGLGIDTIPTDTDESVRAKIKSRGGRVTVAAIDAALAAFFDPIEVDYLFIEWHEALTYCDDDATEYVTDLFCDEDTILLNERESVLIVDDAELSAAEEEAILAILNYVRAMGTAIRIMFWTGADPIYADYPWSVPAFETLLLDDLDALVFDDDEPIFLVV